MAAWGGRVRTVATLSILQKYVPRSVTRADPEENPACRQAPAGGLRFNTSMRGSVMSSIAA